MTPRWGVRAAEDRARRRDPNPISSSKNPPRPQRGTGDFTLMGFWSAANDVLCSERPFVRGSVFIENAFSDQKGFANVNDTLVGSEAARR